NGAGLPPVVGHREGDVERPASGVGVGGRDPGGGPAVTEVPPVRDDLLIIRRRGGVDVEAGPVERRGEVRNRRRGDGHFLRHATGRAVVVGHRQRDLVDAWLL